MVDGWEGDQATAISSKKTCKLQPTMSDQTPTLDPDTDSQMCRKTFSASFVLQPALAYANNSACKQ